MIAYLCGEVADILENSVILDVGGVGYEIGVTGSTCERLSGVKGKVKLHTYLQVKDDGIQIFGFLRKDDLRVFRLLLGVSGIGPKGAIALLSSMEADDLRFAVATGDARAISRAPGIGMKTAQRLIIDLKDKLKLEDALEHLGEAEEEGSSQVSEDSSARGEAMEALRALGIPQADAAAAIRAAGDVTGLDAEEILKRALRQMRL